MHVVSTPSRKISWQEKRRVVNLLEILSTQESKIGERLARLREAHALTQEAAATRAGVTLRAWQRWESGQSTPYARNLAKISDEFGIPLHELVGEEPPPVLTQMDRIEAKLDELLTRLPEALPTVEVEPYPPELEALVQTVIQGLRALAAPQGRAPISPGEYRRGRPPQAAA